MTIELVAATQNAGKAYEIRLRLSGLPICIQTLADKGITEQDPEQGETLGANAESKALHTHRETGGWVLSDDSGIFFAGLPGKAGVRTKEWIGGRNDPDEFESYLRSEFSTVTSPFAVFGAVIMIIDPQGIKRPFSHFVPGAVVLSGRGRIIPHLPLCRHFVPHGQPQTLSEMSTEDFMRYSHRSVALGYVRDFFQERFGP